MQNITIIVGLALMLLGIVSFVGTGSEHPTALIPAGFGLILLVCGILALNEARRKHAMHAAAALGLLGFLGTVGGLLKWFSLLSGNAVARPEAVRAQGIMSLICLVFVLLCVRSFIEARRTRQLAGSAR